MSCLFVLKDWETKAQRGKHFKYAPFTNGGDGSTSHTLEYSLELSWGLWDKVLEIGEHFHPLLTSDGAASIVPWNPGQGDGRGRGFGDSEAGLVRGNCEGKPPASQWKRYGGSQQEGPSSSTSLLPSLPFPPQFHQGLPPQHPELAFSLPQDGIPVPVDTNHLLCRASPCTRRLTMMVSKPPVLVAVQV